jgi:hypothetical protein
MTLVVVHDDFWLRRPSLLPHSRAIGRQRVVRVAETPAATTLPAPRVTHKTSHTTRAPLRLGIPDGEQPEPGASRGLVLCQVETGRSQVTGLGWWIARKVLAFGEGVTSRRTAGTSVTAVDRKGGQPAQ